MSNPNHLSDNAYLTTVLYLKLSKRSVIEQSRGKSLSLSFKWDQDSHEHFQSALFTPQITDLIK